MDYSFRWNDLTYMSGSRLNTYLRKKSRRGFDLDLGEPYFSDYRRKILVNGLYSLYQDYMDYSTPSESHFRDFLHLTGNLQYIPIYEVLLEEGVSLCPIASYEVDKGQVLRPEIYKSHLIENS